MTENKAWVNEFFKWAAELSSRARSRPWTKKETVYLYGLLDGGAQMIEVMREKLKSRPMTGRELLTEMEAYIGAQPEKSDGKSG